MQLKAQLGQLLSGIWNKIKQGSSDRALHISEDDIVVFVVGPTGSGKSWFIREATKSDLVKVSRDYHPCTTNVEAIRCYLTDEAKKDLKGGVNLKSVVFVDTPSFLTGCDQPDAQEEIRAWLDRTVYKPRYVGMIYMHRVETDPALEPIAQHLQQFSAIRQISDGHLRLPQQVNIVMSYDTTSSNITQAKIDERTARLHTQVDSLKNSRWKLSLYDGLFQGDPEVAWRAVEELFRDFPEPTGLL